MHCFVSVGFRKCVTRFLDTAVFCVVCLHLTSKYVVIVLTFVGFIGNNPLTNVSVCYLMISHYISLLKSSVQFCIYLEVTHAIYFLRSEFSDIYWVKYSVNLLSCEVSVIFICLVTNVVSHPWLLNSSITFPLNNPVVLLRLIMKLSPMYNDMKKMSTLITCFLCRVIYIIIFCLFFHV